ncbi:MAG TPA: FliM/FliN family flagellar motor switch protein [Armatimonadota bacterium]|jgi:flagellar motor switch protein FliM
MEQPVSQAELDVLQASLSAYQEHQPRRTEVTVALYDFRDAFGLSPQQVRVMAQETERLGQALNRTLGIYLNGTAQVEFQALNKMKLEQYLGSLPERGFLAAVPCGPGVPEGLLHLDGPLAYTTFDAMLGGPGLPPGIPAREPTPVEAGLFRVLADEVLATWRTMSRFPERLPRRVGEVYYRLSNVDVRSKHDWVLCASYLMQVNQCAGYLTCTFPCSAVRKLLAPAQAVLVAEDPPRESLHATLRHCPLRVRVVLGQTQVPVEQLSGLRVGQVLPLQAPTRQGKAAVAVQVQGQAKFAGETGVHEGQVAVRLLGAVTAVPESGPAS